MNSLMISFLAYTSVIGVLGSITLDKQAKFEEYLKNDVSDENFNVTVTKDQVKFFLHTKNNVENPIKITGKNLNLIDNEKIFFIVHGWLENRENASYYEDFKNVLLELYPESYVIQFDWEEPAFNYYSRAVSSVEQVGKFLGEFIINLHNERNVTMKKVYILAHSLGSHVSGFAGKTVQKVLPKIRRIIAMDPAGPSWFDNPCERRLCKKDAEIVEVIHTSAGVIGYEKPMGHIDFYPNGGKTQKGCMNDAVCDHSRSFLYMSEALKYPHYFISRKCKNWETYQNNPDKCDKKEIHLGDIDTREDGNFYFSTRSQSIFAIEHDKNKSNVNLTKTEDIH